MQKMAHNSVCACEMHIVHVYIHNVYEDRRIYAMHIMHVYYTCIYDASNLVLLFYVKYIK